MQHSRLYVRHCPERTSLCQLVEQYGFMKRGFCLSCGARRMAGGAALLIDEVFPEQPVRQWVLRVPYPRRFLFASRPAAMGWVLLENLLTTLEAREHSLFGLDPSGMVNPAAVEESLELPALQRRSLAALQRRSLPLLYRNPYRHRYP